MKIQTRSITPSAHISEISVRLFLLGFCPTTLCPLRAQTRSSDTSRHGLAQSLAPGACRRKAAIIGQAAIGQDDPRRHDFDSAPVCVMKQVADLAASSAHFR
jgi:hypothetical protein